MDANISEKPTTRIHSLKRALTILELISGEPRGLQIKEISYNLKLHLSTCYHTLNTLEDEGYVVKKNDGCYVLGSKIPFLYNGFVQSISPQRILQEKLYELRLNTNETAYLASYRNNSIEIQMVLESSQAVRVNDIYVGGNDYPHARVLPKVIMAYWDEQELADFFHGYTFPSLTEDAPRNLGELKIELEKVRNQGYIIDDQHVYPGVSCMAAPIFKENGKPVAAFGLSIPGQRFYENKEQLLKELLTTTGDASRSFGYLVPAF